MHAHLFACLYVCAYMFMTSCLSERMSKYACVHALIYVYMHAYMCVCVCVIRYFFASFTSFTGSAVATYSTFFIQFPVAVEKKLCETALH